MGMADILLTVSILAVLLAWALLSPLSPRPRRCFLCDGHNVDCHICGAPKSESPRRTPALAGRI